MDENNQTLLCLLQDSSFTEVEKNRIKKSKKAFDAGYLQACKQFRKQVTTFNAQFVLLDWPSGISYDNDKFLPRSFTLYTLVQRHLLQKEMKQNKIWWNYHTGRCSTFWGPKNVMQWCVPMSTLALIYQPIMYNVFDYKIFTTQKLLTEIHMAILDLGTVKKDLAYLHHVYLSLPPVLIKDLFNFSLYFGFEDMFIYAKAPCWNQAYIHMWPENYFSVLLMCDSQELTLLPAQEWQWHKDAQEPWELEDTWNV